MIEGKLFPNENAANGALNAAHVGWVPPAYSDVGAGRHASHASLAPQRISEPSEMLDGKWLVYGNHPSFKGDFVNPSDIKRNANAVPQAAQIEAQSKGAESGVVARPAAKSKRKAV